MEARFEALEDLGDAVTPLEVPNCKLSKIHSAKNRTGLKKYSGGAFVAVKVPPGCLAMRFVGEAP